LCGPQICFACSQKSIGVWKRSFWNNIGGCYAEILNKVLQYVFILTAGKMATAIAHHRNILEIPKPEEVLS
jgi:hypothetical protein